MDHAELVAFFEERIPFNAHLGIEVEAIEHGRCTLRIPFRPEWVGDPFRPALHGGVLSTLADVAGGLAVFSTVADPQGKVATVDLRIDYLRPGKLDDLLCDAEVIRVGNRVGVTAMTVHHGSDYVAASGRGVYNLLRSAG